MRGWVLIASLVGMAVPSLCRAEVRPALVLAAPQAVSVHDYLLGGPQPRPELEWTSVRHLRLRLGPEFQWLLLTGGVAPTSDAGGFALGVEASLEANPDDALRVTIAHRESRA
jgi:hypothetical protein